DCPLDPGIFKPVVRYADGTQDLRQLGRIGAFTIAGYWSKKIKTADDERIFDLLSRRLNDANERVAMQAAFYLRLLPDPRADVAAAKLLKIENNAIVQPITNALASTAMELPAEYRDKNFVAEAAAGNSRRGRQLFEKLGCVKCHAANATDAGGGALSLV